MPGASFAHKKNTVFYANKGQNIPTAEHTTVITKKEPITVGVAISRSMPVILNLIAAADGQVVTKVLLEV